MKTKLFKDHKPWERFLTYIKYRCKHHPDYNGERRKIDNFLTKEDLKLLWFKHNAHLLHKPSIDRIDTTGDYILNNCRFVEVIDNQRRPKHIYARFKGSRLCGRWSYKYECCIECNTTELVHSGKGLCSKCFDKKWFKEHPQVRKNYYKNRVNKYGRLVLTNTLKEWRRKNAHKVIQNIVG